MNSLEFAIKMELEGEKYYTQQAEFNKNNSLHAVFLSLAKDEKCHAELLQSKFSEAPYELDSLKNNSTLAQAKNVFAGIKDFKSEVRSTPNQVELYQEAMNTEKKSIELYEKLLSESADEKSKELFKYLIRQETDHYTVFEELTELVNRPNDWVEAAEFGVRKEY